MEINKEDLVERFQTFSDEELVRRIRLGTLIPLAHEVATAELRNRGVEGVEKQQATEETPEEVSSIDNAELEELAPADHADLVRVAGFTDSLQANLFRGRLESEGIYACIWGAHQGANKLFWSNALNDIEVQVRADQLVEARAILAAYEKGEFELDDSETGRRAPDTK